MSTEAMRATLAALAELLDAHDADYTGWSTHEMTEHWRRVKDAARAALAQQADECLRIADAIDPMTRKGLDNLTCAVAAKLLRSIAAPAAPAYVPLSDEQVDKILDRERMRWATSPPTYEFPHAVCRAIESLVAARMRGEGK